MKGGHFRPPPDCELGTSKGSRLVLDNKEQARP